MEVENKVNSPALQTKTWECTVCSTSNISQSKGKNTCHVCFLTWSCRSCGNVNKWEANTCETCSFNNIQNTTSKKRKSPIKFEPPKKKRKLNHEKKQTTMDRYITVTPISEKRHPPLRDEEPKDVLDWADSDTEPEELLNEVKPQAKIDAKQKTPEHDDCLLTELFALENEGEFDNFVGPKRHLDSELLALFDQVRMDLILNREESPLRPMKKKASPKKTAARGKKRGRKPKNPNQKAYENRWGEGAYIKKQNAKEFTEEGYEKTNFPGAEILESVPQKGEQLIISPVITDNVPDRPGQMKHPTFNEEDIKLILKAKVVVIFGKSGSGKTSLLKQLGEIARPKWDNEESILSNFHSHGEDYISAAGLRSVPNFVKPYRVLSQGERARADFALLTEQGKRSRWRNPIIIDEFTSDLDRSTARSMAASAASAIARSYGRGQFIFASCNVDVLHFLQPDLLVYVSDGKIAIMNNTNFAKKPIVTVSITPRDLLPLRNNEDKIERVETHPREMYGNKPIIDMQALNQRKHISKAAHTESKIQGGIVLKNKVKQNPKNNSQFPFLYPGGRCFTCGIF